MVSTAGTRIGWGDLPSQVRHAVESIIGGPVVEAVSQVGGFSPGTADRVRTADGQRAFVKAVSTELNPESPTLHRQEARVAAALPDHAPAPRLLGCHDDGQWVALVLADAEGRQPATPWRADELRRVLDALAELAAALTPSPVAGVRTAADLLSGEFVGWRNIAQQPPDDLPPWLERRLDRLCTAAEHGLAALHGDTLVHTDVRADNLLLGADGAVTVVDWPHACRGPAWLDRLLLLVNVRLYGGHDTDRLLSELAEVAGVPMADLLAALTGLAGFFTDSARRPPPPGLPTLRAFQRAQADAVLSWLREVDPDW